MKETSQTIIRQIQNHEDEGLYQQAQLAREKLLAFVTNAGEKEFPSGFDFLAKEKITIRHVEEACEIEPFYLRLNSLLRERLPGNDPTIARVLRKLAKIYYIQNRVKEAVRLFDQIIPIFSEKLGKNSDEAIEAVHAAMQWQREIDVEQARKFEDWVRREYPCCEHLKSVENYLSSRGLELRYELSFRGKVTLWVNAWLGLDSIYEKLKLIPAIEKVSVDDMKGDTLRGFRCIIDKHEINGIYEQDPKWPVIV